MSQQKTKAGHKLARDANDNRKKIMKKGIVIACLVLGGCQAATPQASRSLPVEQNKTEVDDLLAGLNHQSSGSGISEYAASVAHAIQYQLFDATKWAGKACSIRIHLQPDGLLTGAEVEDGDPDFCQAALDATRKAKIPPAPDDKTYQVFKNAVLNFKL